MSETKKHKEFWINFGNSNGTSVRTRTQFEQTTFPRCPDYQADAIHVIEYSALLEEKQKVKELVDGIKAVRRNYAGPTQMEDSLNAIKNLDKLIKKYGDV